MQSRHSNRSQRSFIISVKITETTNSAESNKLNGPPYKLKRVAEMVSLLSTTKPDVRVVFKDRTYIDTHSKILMERCNYFKTLLTSDFAESRKRTLATPSTSDRPAKISKSDQAQSQGPERSATTRSASDSITPRVSTQYVHEQAVSVSALGKEGNSSTVKAEDNEGQESDGPIPDRGALIDGRVPSGKESDNVTESPAKAGQVGGGADELSEASDAGESSDGQDSGELRRSLRVTETHLTTVLLLA